ncbi:VanW family protein [Christensenellaceae bacterium OttesenSCG-928-K19]|nr:VanW family protein [Christensenellaceae bacterium OttesenSCG-928-K19]
MEKMQRLNWKKIIYLAAVIAFLLLTASCSAQEEPTPQATVDISPKVFDEGVHVEGVDVSGLSLEDGAAALADAIDALLETSITFSVETPDAPLEYSYRLNRLGVSIDAEPFLREVFGYKNEGGGAVNFQFDLAADESYVLGLMEGLQEEYDWGLAPVNSSYYVKKSSDEDNLTTGGTLEISQPEDGYEVNLDELAATIVSKIEARDFSDFEAPLIHLDGKDEVSAVGEMVLMGRYRTYYESSSEGRRYNIWKISDKLNGAKLYAGQVFSINDHVGERNEGNGWAVAYGIEDGIYTEQYGGGICQVSSTFYNATLRAEMEPVSRVPHTIAASYVPKGMDATISTGGPDYKVKNVLDTNMYVIVTCNEPESWVQVELYGTLQRDYELEFWSELVEEIQKPAPVYETNSSLGAYEIKQVRPGQKGEGWEVYRKKTGYDGTVIEEKESVTTSTYKPIVPKYQVGSGIPLPADGTPLSDVQALAASLSSGGSTTESIESGI